MFINYIEVMKIYREYIDVCKRAAMDAGEKIMEIYQTDFHNTIEMKSDNSPLTIADKASNEIIIKALHENFPEVSILSEESKQDATRFKNDLCFVVDPLDGTKEFIKRNGEFTVNIALADKHKVKMGIIYLPVTKALYYAAEGYGAFKELDGKTTKLLVTDKVDELVLAVSKSHASDELKELVQEKKHLIAQIISAGSSLKGAMIAEGKADVYYRFGYTYEWDTAAMQCIVEQAGGYFRQMDGTEMTYNREKNLNEKGFFALNRKENQWI
ncbi:MAG: 3'(2'),5'-bisphosphate nucleotidase CysQ [Eubacteriales bacterium]